MPGVLLIVTDTLIEISTVERALEEAKKRSAALSVLSVLDPTSAEKIASKLLDTGQVGSRPSEGFLDSLHARHEQLAVQAADEGVAQARNAGVTASGMLRRGDFTNETRKAVREILPDAVVIERQRKALKYSPLHAALEDLGARLGFEIVET